MCCVIFYISTSMCPFMVTLVKYHYAPLIYQLDERLPCEKDSICVYHSVGWPINGER